LPKPTETGIGTVTEHLSRAEMSVIVDAGVRDGDTIRPPATNEDVAWLTRVWRSPEERARVVAILSALRATP
jgi:hypothetical protein